MSHEKINMDAALAGWAAPDRPESEWEAQADAIAAAMKTSPTVTAAELSALCDVAALPAEAGEPGPEPKAPPIVVQARSGEKTMSQDADPTSGSPKTESNRPSEGEPKKKLSLKEIAARASQSGRPGPVSGGGRSSQSEIPPAVKTPIPARASAPSRPSATPSRISDSGKEDSGIVDLKSVQAAATAEQKAAAEKAQPGTVGLFDDDKGQAKAAVAATAAKPELKAVAPAPAEKKGSGGLVAGVVVAVLGLAAAFAIVKMNQPPPAATAPPPAKPEVTETKAAAVDQPKAEATAADPAAPAATAAAPADAPQKGAPGPALAMGGPASPGPAAGAPKEGPAPAEASPPVAAATPATPAKPGDLSSAMQNAVGPAGKQPAGGEEPEPAAGKKGGSQNVPEKPPQGAVNAALASGIGTAKSCVAGADDVSRATVTFGSSGAATGVSVTGWAAGKSAAGCIKSAFKGANVGPFSQPSFTIGVTIRP
jgi:hypothetical protein